MKISNIVFGLVVLCCTSRTIKLSSPVRLHLYIWCQYHHAQDSFYCVSLRNCTSLFLSLHCTKCTIQIHTLERKGRWESNINVWFPIMYSQKWNCYSQNIIIIICLSVPSLVHISVRDLQYIFPGSVCLFCCREICGPILGIYKSLTDTWMWKLALRLPNSQKRNT